MCETTARYDTPTWINAVLFAGVIAWEGAAAFLFCLACWRFRGTGEGRQSVYLAFTVSLLLWAAFLIADELFIAYAIAGTHLRLLTALLATLLLVELLPENSQAP